VLKFLLFASAKDTTTVPTKVTNACKRFINSDSKALADQELNIQFQSRNLHDVAFSTGFTQAIYGGRFRWSDQSSSSNFSPFLMYEVEPIHAAEQQNCHFVLHIVLTQGKGQTLDKIKSSNKQIVKAPTTYLEMMAQLKSFAGACNIFFGEYSAATKSIKALITVTQKIQADVQSKQDQQRVCSSISVHNQ
jgi:hypothetical protein